jgi:hypothetical protein
MPFTRREFIKASAVVGCAGIVGIPGLHADEIQAPPQAFSNPTFFLNQTTLRQHLRSRFRVERGGIAGDTTLKLIKVVDRASGSNSPTYECFSAYFAGSKTLPLDQGTYVMHHRELGTFQLFIVPAGSGRKQHYYEALFNRI